MASLSRQVRVGLVVPKYRFGAVARNLLKRRIREIVRLKLMPFLAGNDVGIDLVLHARISAYAVTFEALSNAVERVGHMVVASLPRQPNPESSPGSIQR